MIALAIGLISVPRLLEAQVGLRIGVGPAYGQDVGGAGTFALRYRGGGVLAMGEARGIATGAVGDWEGSARALAVGVGLGAIDRQPRGPVRRYAAGTLGIGVDPRENDRLTTFGAAVGLESVHFLGVYGELRYERWRQRGVRHHDLPAGMLSLVVGLAVH